MTHLTAGGRRVATQSADALVHPGLYILHGPHTVSRKLDGQLNPTNTSEYTTPELINLSPPTFVTFTVLPASLSTTSFHTGFYSDPYAKHLHHMCYFIVAMMIISPLSSPFTSVFQCVLIASVSDPVSHWALHLDWCFYRAICFSPKSYTTQGDLTASFDVEPLRHTPGGVERASKPANTH
ncbi:hypothetical protein Pst134EA_015329 [Puccinia striiformis f. sp. tritici]|uniref:hypothetical protein n=1 Tax=Puccinia striiformis f. sp. tritici TaxID=168172 RepID=UPI002007DF59|nr:hypothetical protein Pst134EA_015329 [Puccinia striiformis f. sp. tritici]KAH9463245.1 hypothetical protein Pst134EA_015329 [Puccinia striiformis f. sp. tritici]